MIRSTRSATPADRDLNGRRGASPKPATETCPREPGGATPKPGVQNRPQPPLVR